MTIKTYVIISLLITLTLITSCKSSGSETVSTEADYGYELDFKYFPAKGEGQNAALIFLGGSEGGYPYTHNGYADYIEAGYSCLSLAYFGTENTPEELELIPLEYFKAAIDWYKSLPEIKGKKIVINGYSKGGEAALLIASKYPEIEGVIVSSPSSVVFQGFTNKLTSPWTINEEPIPFVPLANVQLTDEQYINMEFLELYEESLKQDNFVGEASIHVENINGPILLFSGGDDIVLPSAYMGEVILNRVKDNGFEYEYSHIVYKDTGHTFNEYYMLGGTREGNRAAMIDSYQQEFNFLEKLH